MNREDIIRMAEEAGVHEGGKENWVNGNRWETFAAIVAAAEREACAKICDETNNWPIAHAIRARGQG